MTTIKKLLIDCANFVQPYCEGGGEEDQLMARLNEAIEIDLTEIKATQKREMLEAYAELVSERYTHHFFSELIEESIDEFLGDKL